MLKLKVTDIQERIFLLLLTLFVFFYGLSAYGLFDNNEGLYAEIAREMLERGNFVIPTLNGAPYIEKPPLLYWLLALSFKVFGVGEYSARLVPAMAGFVSVWGVYIFMRRFQSARPAFYAALMLSTAVGYIAFSHMIFFDVLLTCFLTLALLFYFEWWRTGGTRHLIFFYVFMAASVMTKGGVALVLVGITLMAFWVFEKRGWMHVLKTFNPLGMVVFLALVLPWHVLASLEDRNFLHFYFVNEHVYRFLDIREPRDYYRGPWYYYMHRLALYLLPWLPLVGFRARLENPHSDQRTLKRFLWCWMIVFFCFFSLSKAKANYYVVTLMPAVFLYLGLRLGSFAEERLSGAGRILPLIAGGIFPLIFTFGCIIVWSFDLPYRIYVEDLNPFYLGGFLIALWVIYGFSLIRGRYSLRAWIYSIALQSIVVWAYAQTLITQYEQRVSSKEIAKALPKDVDRIYFYRDYEKMSSIRFYLNQPVYVIDSLSNDLHYAKSNSLSPYFVTDEEVLKGLNVVSCVFVFHEQQKRFEEQYTTFKLESSASKQVFRLPSRVFLYCNRP
ncbi:MAG: ArnT family glycosyltransferase [Candidatus Nucleicultricaceae bacterium]